MTITFRGKRIDTGDIVEGQYVKTPLTDENSGTNPEIGWFFLSDNNIRHCIVKDHVVYVVEETSIEVVITSSNLTIV